MKLILFDFLFEDSVDNMFDKYNIDGIAYREDFLKRESLYNSDCAMPIINGYSFLDFKLKHPTIYYALN